MKVNDILVEIGHSSGPLDLVELFSNDNPVEVEVGSGTGRFISSEALNRPDINFLGIELARTWARNAARRIQTTDARNVRIISVEAARFFRESVFDGTVTAVHIYFPDPWPKQRHAKRRLFTPDFVEDLIRILVSGGHIRFATDIRGYFIHVQRLFMVRSELVQKRDDTGAVQTGYAQKFLDVGRPVFQTVFQKQ